MMKTDQTPPTEPVSRKRTSLQNRWVIVATVIVLLILAVLSILPRLNLQPAVVPMTTASPTDAAPMEAAPSLGPETAPVTIIIYSDFGCPACWAWYKLGVLDDLRAEYGDQVRFIWRDFPVITLLSPKAAEAGQCAHEQGKFWEFHDLVYDNEGTIEASDLKAYAAEIGLDMEQFNECVTSRRYRLRVNAEQHESFQRGFRGTPAFMVNDQPVVGLQRLSAFEDLINPLLAPAK
jgi:protein-disulfide isomerase